MADSICDTIVFISESISSRWRRSMSCRNASMLRSAFRFVLCTMTPAATATKAMHTRMNHAQAGTLAIVVLKIITAVPAVNVFMSLQYIYIMWCKDSEKERHRTTPTSFFSPSPTFSTTGTHPAPVQARTLREIACAPCACYSTQGAHKESCTVSAKPHSPSSKRTIHHAPHLTPTAFLLRRAATPSRRAQKNLGEWNRISNLRGRHYLLTNSVFISEEYRSRVIATKLRLFSYLI
ncbi:MAG: hypothetical protein K2I99_08475 [Bacteroidaceae bacterium]|nr:hypothetical protein [Bacteroidaceae bacterium]